MGALQNELVWSWLVGTSKRRQHDTGYPRQHRFRAVEYDETEQTTHLTPW